MLRPFAIFLFSLLSPVIIFAQVKSIRLKFENGQIIAGFESKTGQKQFTLETRIPSTVNTTTELVSASNETIVTSKQIHYFQHACVVTNTVKKTAYGLQWDMEILGNDSDWTAPIVTQLQWDDPAPLKFWTTWADNHTAPQTGEWQDPFVPAPFQDLNLIYGGETHLSNDAFVAPIASTFLNKEDIGLSFIESVNDTILGLEMRTSAAGLIAYKHLNHRIGRSRAIHFRYQLVLHVADWRAGMSWMMDRYKDFFVPEEPLVNDMAGGGAYSSYEGSLDTGKYHKMGLSLVWKASFDFPYMGMFIPPVKDADEKWLKYTQGGVIGGDGYATINRLNRYAERMNTMGFHTLSYFNVNEFGNGIKYPYKLHKVPEAGRWKNPNEYVYTKLKHAFVKPAGVLPDWDDQPLFSNWEDCIVLDPADSVYHTHLLEQVKMQIEKIPASSGICIDRLDWMRFYNTNGDDSVSMVGEQKTRSLIISWKGIMKPISGLLHNAHKVIYCNPLYRRADMMEHIDGIFDEYGYLPSSVNLCTQMSFLKPVISWVSSKNDLMPDPDAYFQRYLYLGSFLTTPFPGNDHCIEPDAWAEKYYEDYGMLFLAIRGRAWVMSPNIVEIEHGIAKATVFSVGAKIILPVMLGGAAGEATILLRLPYAALGKKRLHLQVIYPGDKDWKILKVIPYADTIKLSVALKRGCALLCIE